MDEIDRSVRCASCKKGSGLSGRWKNSPALLQQLHVLGWTCVHAGHRPGRDGDPRVWVCPDCLPTWRDGEAVRDLERLMPAYRLLRQGL